MGLSVVEQHFFFMLGACWDNARLAQLEFRLVMADETTVVGVPECVAVAVDDRASRTTGLVPLLLLGGCVVDPLEVLSYSVGRPVTGHPGGWAEA